MEVQIAGSLDTVTYFVRMPDCIEEMVINYALLSKESSSYWQSQIKHYIHEEKKLFKRLTRFSRAGSQNLSNGPLLQHQHQFEKQPRPAAPKTDAISEMRLH